MSRIFDAVRIAEKLRAAKRAVATAVEVEAPAPPAAAESAGSADSGTNTIKPMGPGKQRSTSMPRVPPAASPVIVRPAGAFGVVGVTWEDVAAGPDHNPHQRLAQELKKQLTRVNFRHTDMKQALVYGDGGADAEALQMLRKKYRDRGRFCEFAFFSETSRAACAQFSIELKILDFVELDFIPAHSVVLLQEPYFPGV